MNPSKPAPPRAPYWATHYALALNGYGSVHLISEYKGEDGAIFIDGQLASVRRTVIEKLLYKEDSEKIAEYAKMTPYDAKQHTLDAYIARA